LSSFLLAKLMSSLKVFISLNSCISLFDNFNFSNTLVEDIAFFVISTIFTLMFCISFLTVLVSVNKLDEFFVLFIIFSNSSFEMMELLIIFY